MQRNHEEWATCHHLTGQEYEDLGDLEHRGREGASLSSNHPQLPRLERLKERGFVTETSSSGGLRRFALTDEGRRALREFDGGFVCSDERRRRMGL